MVETLKEIMDFIETSKQEVGGSVAKAVVWAHNSHLGDASATDAAKNKEVNIGQLVREKWGKEDTFNIGFTTYTGTLTMGIVARKDILMLFTTRHGLCG
jgi:erythromycin esterase-like protein